MRYLRKGKTKWTRHPFVKEKAAYLGVFFNEISSSLLFSNPLTVRWRDSDPHQPPRKGANFRLMVKEEAEKEKRREQNLKRSAATNHWDSWDCLHSRMPYIKGCVWGVLCVCPSKDTRHAGNQAVSQTSLSYVTQSVAVQQLEARKNNFRKGKHPTYLWSLVLNGGKPHTSSDRNTISISSFGLLQGQHFCSIRSPFAR